MILDVSRNVRDCISHQQRTDPGCQHVLATKFGKATPEMFGCTAQNLLHVTLLAPRILRWLPDLGKFVHTHIKQHERLQCWILCNLYDFRWTERAKDSGPTVCPV
jgi:hypothetical protein